MTLREWGFIKIMWWMLVLITFLLWVVIREPIVFILCLPLAVIEFITICSLLAHKEVEL